MPSSQFRSGGTFPPLMVPSNDPYVSGHGASLRFQGSAHRPVMFDILAPDQETSILDRVSPGLRMVFHVNPAMMKFSYEKNTSRVTTRGGFVEFHWGDAPAMIAFEGATGGFMRLEAGLSNITSSGSGAQGRRETIAYDKYLDLLALYKNNGAVYDRMGNIAAQGSIKMIFDGGTHTGWFDDGFTVTEDASRPYVFTFSGRFLIDREHYNLRTSGINPPSTTMSAPNAVRGGQEGPGATPLLGDDGSGGGGSPIGLLGRDSFSPDNGGLF